MGTTATGKRDPIAETLRTYAQNILVVVFGFLPILFIPSQLAPFEYTKIALVSVGVLSALVLYSLSALRSGGIPVGISYPVIGAWGLAAVGFVTALLSGDFKDAFWGDVMSTHTAAFLLLIALILSVWVVADVEKQAVLKFYFFLSISTAILVFYHIIRLMTGPDIFTLGVFTGDISTPVGGWNDLALFLGLSIILSLIAMDQFPLTRNMRIAFSVVTVLSLLMLGVINFFVVWVILGITSLAVMVYALTKDRFAGAQLPLIEPQPFNAASLRLSLCVFVVSVLFIVGGSVLGGWVSQKTGITYLEVRPSPQITADIARNVYNESPMLGIGPNKFVDAWRMYKDPAINTTAFWNTDFIAGNGYVTTFFITMGVLGIVAWLFFLGSFVVAGIRMLLIEGERDPMWYFIGISAFVSALYIWGMAIIYVPGAVILMLGALCTGITLTAEKALSGRKNNLFPWAVAAAAQTPRATKKVELPAWVTDRRTGFIFTMLAIAVILGSVSGLYGVGKHYAAAYAFNSGVNAIEKNRTVAKQEIERAFSLYPSDVYARQLGEIELARLNEILEMENPSEEIRAEYIRIIQSSVNAAEQAKNLDSKEPQNWTLLGNIYSVLMSANIEGVYDKAKEALTRARELNPHNPLSALNLAVLEGRAGNYDAARAHTNEAIGLRPNFTDAFYFLSQLDVATGNVEGAIRSTLSIITLEPQNPVRYYQLGVLEAARNNTQNAIRAFEEAVRLDPNYANARYLLAVAYDLQGRKEDAVRELQKVLELNPGNTEVSKLIENLTSDNPALAASTEPEAETLETSPALEEVSGVQEDDDGTVTTDADPETPLVSPVNTIPEEDNEG